MTPMTRAALAAALLAVPVALEIAVPVVGDHVWGDLLFATTQLAGWVLLTGLCLALRGAAGATARPGRIGARLVLAACAGQLAFAATYGVLVAAGRRPDAAFAMFGLAFLLLTVGGTTWGLALRRAGASRAGTALVAVAALGLLAIAVPVDPFHDAFLLGSYLAWVPVGRALAQPGADRTVALSVA